MSPAPPRRFKRLASALALGERVPLATGFRARLLGLALLPRDRAGPGLLIPRCRSVHTFGMRFPIDVVFLDRDGAEIKRAVAVPPNRMVGVRGASSVLELPAKGSTRPPRRCARGRGWRARR